MDQIILRVKGSSLQRLRLIRELRNKVKPSPLRLSNPAARGVTPSINLLPLTILPLSLLPLTENSVAPHPPTGCTETTLVQLIYRYLGYRTPTGHYTPLQSPSHFQRLLKILRLSITILSILPLILKRCCRKQLAYIPSDYSTPTNLSLPS